MTRLTLHYYRLTRDGRCQERVVASVVWRPDKPAATGCRPGWMDQADLSCRFDRSRTEPPQCPLQPGAGPQTFGRHPASPARSLPCSQSQLTTRSGRVRLFSRATPSDRVSGGRNPLPANRPASYRGRPVAAAPKVPGTCPGGAVDCTLVPPRGLSAHAVRTPVSLGTFWIDDATSENRRCGAASAHGQVEHIR